MGNAEGKQLVHIDGGISSGKTTLCDILKSNQDKYASFVSSLSEDLVVERLSTLEETGHLHGILTAWLENPDELAAQFQMHMFSSCVTRLNTANLMLRYDKDISCVIIDRSLDGNAVFATTSAIEPYNRLSSTEFGFYKTAFRSAKLAQESDTLTSIAPQKYCQFEVFLWVKPENCISRCMKRGTDGEDSYDIGYFRHLQMISAVQIMSHYTTKDPRKMVVLNWNDPKSEEQIVESFYEDVSAYVRSDFFPRMVEISTEDPVDLSPYSRVLDFSAATSERDVFSHTNVELFFEAISYSHRIPHQIVFVKLPKHHVGDYPFDSPFKIKIT